MSGYNKKKKYINSKINKSKSHMTSSDKSIKNTVTPNKIKISMICLLLAFCLLITRIGFLQFVQGAELKESAYKQQIVDRLINPRRGNILDSTGKVLASSAQVDTVSINPTKIKGKDADSTQAKKESLASAFSEIFGLNYDETLAKINSNSSVQTIIKRVEQDKIDKLRAWMKENDFSVGINIDSDTKRYYPYNNLAAYVIGFCNNDNQGIYGVERSYNNYLTGTPGKILTSADVNKDEISDKDQQYIEAENGNNIVLTIDAYIQTITEKYLKQAVEENRSRSGNVIIMNPNSGDIIAMASYPDYNLNTPFEPTSPYWKDRWESLNSQEKIEMYRNISISSTYEPGSTFKVLNAAIALEEDFTSTDVSNDFNCIGYESINDIRINCWASPNSHGPQTLRKVLENSCNPGMMQLANRVGRSTLYRYYGAFGLFSKTDVGLPEEATGIFHASNNISDIDLATLGFGQGITVTPLQLTTAICSIANDGVLMKPKIVKQIVNTDTNIVTNIDSKKIRQVISPETAREIRNIMESVVTDGTGSSGAVRGYSVGGKTGTSESLSKKTNTGYVASYVGISPVENPEVVILATLYDPQVKNYHGGTVAGPVVSNILAEVLPYLGISPDKIDVDKKTMNNIVTVPDVRNKTVTEAQKKLTTAGFRSEINVSGNKNEIIITDQVPAAGTRLPNNSLVMLYTAENNVRVSTTVPKVLNMSAAQAANSLKSKNLNISVEGTSGIIESQEPAAGSSVEQGTVIKVVLKNEE